MGNLTRYSLMALVVGTVCSLVFHDQFGDLLSAPVRARAEQEQLKKDACGYYTVSADEYRTCRARLELGLK